MARDITILMGLSSAVEVHNIHSHSLSYCIFFDLTLIGFDSLDLLNRLNDCISWALSL